jgi:hypothetical protein
MILSFPALRSFHPCSEAKSEYHIAAISKMAPLYEAAMDSDDPDFVKGIADQYKAQGMDYIAQKLYKRVGVFTEVHEETYQEKSKRYGKLTDQVIAYIEKKGHSTSHELRMAFNLTVNEWHQVAQKLRSSGIIQSKHRAYYPVACERLL